MAWSGPSTRSTSGVNDYEKPINGGLYRVTASHGDDQLDKVELLRAHAGRGDHGVHAVLPAPDGKSVFLVTGNGTKPTEFNRSRVPPIWGEDHLLPRMPDGRGFMRDVLAPGGIIYRVSPDGKDFEVWSQRLPQHLRRRVQPRRRAVHLRRRHGVRLQHAVVPADAHLPRASAARNSAGATARASGPSGIPTTSRRC